MSDDVTEPTAASESLRLMYKVIEDPASDWTLYGAVADELDQIGYPALAHAYRWCMARRRRPHARTRYASGAVVPRKFRWAWYAETDLGEPYPGYGPIEFPDPAAARPHVIPRLLLGGFDFKCGSHGTAVGHLAGRLTLLARTCALDPDAGSRGPGGLL